MNIYPNQSDRRNNFNILVSIVIPTFNSMPFVKSCVESILGQTYTQWELIIVDGGSTDDTLKVVRSINSLIYINNGMGMSEATNFGVARSHGKYVYRVDSDVVLDPTLIQECVTACEKKGYDAIGIFWGPDSNVSIWAKVRKLEKESYRHDLTRIGARFLKKSLFEKVGGYNPELVAGEDYDFYNRIATFGAKVGEVRSEELHLGEPKTLAEVVRKQYRYGKTISRFLNQKRRNIIHVSPLRLSIIRNFDNFIKDPLALFTFPIYFSVVYLSALIGFISSKL